MSTGQKIAVSRARLRALCLLLFTVSVGGCAASPNGTPSRPEGEQQRILQQTISQLRLGLDDVRTQRDEVQGRYHNAEKELETAHRELAFLEAQIRADRKLGSARGSELGGLRGDYEERVNELAQSKERITRLERERTTIRAAFDQDQLNVVQLRGEKSTLTGEIETLRAEISSTNSQWGAERSELRAHLQSRDDELAILTEQVAKGDIALKEALASAAANAMNPSGSSGSATRGAPGSTGSAAPAARGGVGSKAGWIDQTTEAFTFAVAQIQKFMADPGENWRTLLHPIPIGIVLVVLCAPLLLWRVVRRRRRPRTSGRKVSEAASLPAEPRVAQRTERSMPSVAIRRRSETPVPAVQTAPPISPQTVGSMAATLDAVLGGDSLATAGRAPTAAPGGDEDDLLGDLRDIVQKGLS